MIFLKERRDRQLQCGFFTRPLPQRGPLASCSQDNQNSWAQWVPFQKKTQYKYDLANPIDQLCMVNHPIFSKAIHWFVLLVANYHASSWGSGTLVICFHACWLRQNNASDSNVSAAGSTGFFVDFSVKSWATPFSLSQPIHWFNKLLWALSLGLIHFSPSFSGGFWYFT